MINLKPFFLCTTIAWSLVYCTPLVSLAQNADGDYVQAALPTDPDSGPDYVNSHWQIVTPSGLNCRSGPGLEFDVVKALALGDTFYVQTSIGRDQHNNPIMLDSQDRPWFKVADSAQGDIQCFARANQRYAEPASR